MHPSALPKAQDAPLPDASGHEIHKAEVKEFRNKMKFLLG